MRDTFWSDLYSFIPVDFIALLLNEFFSQVIVFNQTCQIIEFLNNPNLDLRPVGLIDDDVRKQKKLINGYPVLKTIDSLKTILGKNSISTVILSFDDISRKKLDRLFHICLSHLFHEISLRRSPINLEEIPVR